MLLPPEVQDRIRAERLGQRAAGLANAVRGAGQGAMAPVHDQLGGIAAPTLVIAGKLDEVGRQRAELVAGKIPGARLEVLAGAGHAPHLESPDDFRRLVDRLPDQPPAEEPPVPTTWTKVRDFTDIRYEHSGTGIARVTIDRPEVRNAFRPETVAELIDAFRLIRDDASIGVVLLTGAGDKAFCSGGDHARQDRRRLRGTATASPRLNVLDLQREIRSLPDAGHRAGQRLRDRRRARAARRVRPDDRGRQRAASARPGRRSARSTGATARPCSRAPWATSKAREIWYLCRQYTAQQALEMGLVNTVVPLAKLEEEGVAWADGDPGEEPDGDPLPEAAFNADTDGLAGLQELAGDATMLYYLTDEAHEGSSAFLEKRKPDFSKFPRRP